MSHARSFHQAIQDVFDVLVPIIPKGDMIDEVSAVCSLHFFEKDKVQTFVNLYHGTENVSAHEKMRQEKNLTLLRQKTTPLERAMEDWFLDVLAISPRIKNRFHISLYLFCQDGQTRLSLDIPRILYTDSDGFLGVSFETKQEAESERLLDFLSFLSSPHTLGSGTRWMISYTIAVENPHPQFCNQHKCLISAQTHQEAWEFNLLLNRDCENLNISKFS